MYHTNNEKWGKKNNRKNRTTKSGKHQKIYKKENYKYPRTLEVDNIKQPVIKEKVRKKYLKRMRKIKKTKFGSRNLIKGIHSCSLPCKILWTILKMDKRGTKMDRSKNVV